mgnify:CR=1 FL=1
MAEAALNQLKAEFETLHKGKLAMDAQLLDPMMLQEALNFYAFSAEWLVHLVDPERKGCALSRSPSHTHWLYTHNSSSFY